MTAHVGAPPAAPVSASGATGAPAGVAAALPSGQSPRSTSTARSASSTQPRTATVVAPAGVRSRRTTQRSGRAASPSRLRSGVTSSRPRRRASGGAHWRWTPAGRAVPAVNGGGNPGPWPSGAFSADGSRTMGSSPPSGTKSACTSIGTSSRESRTRPRSQVAMVPASRSSFVAAAQRALNTSSPGSRAPAAAPGGAGAAPDGSPTGGSANGSLTGARSGRDRGSGIPSARGHQ